ncbi:MAG TPA: inner membrane-spanning protein YciB [Woeseiaceae bacterium]|nr:inner membrane-spanning protein YciB [Woeseiaceae bacterium]
MIAATMSALRLRSDLRYDAPLLTCHDGQTVLFLADFLPLLLFLVAYFYKDIYLAVIVLMIAMPVGLLIKYLVSRKIDRIYLWSTIFLLVLGGATVFLRNPAFLYWKPTAFYWALAVAFFASQWIGEKPLVQKFFGLVGELKTDQVSPTQWRKLNLVWVVFFLSLGLLNIYVAYNFAEADWVRFKVFGLLGLTLIFMTAQTFWIVSKIDKTSPGNDHLES